MIGNIGNAIVVFMVIIVLISGIAGFRHTDVDLLNPQSANAAADKTRDETERQRQQWDMEISYVQAERAAQSQLTIQETENQARILDAQTEAELARIEVDKTAYLAHQREQQRLAALRHNQQVAIEADRQLALTVVLTTAALALIFVLTAVAIRYLMFTEKPALQTQAANKWHDPRYRRTQVEQARQREQARRTWERIRPESNGRQQRVPPSAN